MDIFLSWSGERSRLFAETLHQWLPKVIQNVKPWMSSSDIDKGLRWISEISDRLTKSNFGIICLTTESYKSPWLLFEAGAISSKIGKSKVCPILLDFKPSVLSGPLSQFQATEFSKEDIYKLLKTINKNFGSKELPDNQLKETFDVWWPNLEKEIAKIPESVEKKPEKSQYQMIEEILTYTRTLSNTIHLPNWIKCIIGANLKMLAHLKPRQEIIIRIILGIQRSKNQSITEISKELDLTDKQIKNSIEDAKKTISKIDIIDLLIKEAKEIYEDEQ